MAGSAEEPHYALSGESCVTCGERADARQQHASPLFGEMRYEGVCSLASNNSLGIGHPSVKRVIDFGSGLGKAAVQLFFQHAHLVHVLGVELMPSRYNLSALALSRLYDHLAAADKSDPPRFRHFSGPKRVALEECMERGQIRVLELRRQNMFQLEHDVVSQADVILCDVDLALVRVCFDLSRVVTWLAQVGCHTGVCRLFNLTKRGCRIMSYSDLAAIYVEQRLDSPLTKNRRVCVKSSWNLSTPGHNFYGYVRG